MLPRAAARRSLSRHGVRMLTTTAWARAAPGDHRDGETAVRRAVSRLECGAQNAPRGSARASGRPGATGPSTSQHG